MRGKANPAYTLGNRVQQRQGRTRTGMCVWQVKEIERWMRLRDRTARQLADMIGVSRMAVHKRARSIAARQQTNNLHGVVKSGIILPRQANGE